ncbi:hypothetical protein POF50_003515 [Streptomyces sp. SL13]|jgi:hypothetical protein|uniref:Uncharacterized protein n=1 Tax=Streptantibioticus silvisoli TaxID=2705255 RepID=A0AA90GUW9_9ACTN|nr:hypothetical protein [Streptantibioticus silvisoli]MDI5968424.1 hypothetical protein [Streptantibioticus silvisoli]
MSGPTGRPPRGAVRRYACRALLVTTGAGLLLGGTGGVSYANDDSPPATESRGAAFSLIDNSHADSWLEVDRTLNQQLGSGTAGSDHDGAEVSVSDSPATATAPVGTATQAE